MRYEDLPESELVGKGCLMATLFLLLVKATENRTAVFTHTDRAIGGPRSCRLLFTKPDPTYTETVAFPDPLNCGTAAATLIQFAKTEARFPTRPNEHLKKGFEIRTGKSGGRKFVIVLADWVSVQEDQKYMIEVGRNMPPQASY
ncbi:MAG: hypothetical protein AAB780_00705 [Patescibacteria group bacterium]